MLDSADAAVSGWVILPVVYTRGGEDFRGGKVLTSFLSINLIILNLLVSYNLNVFVSFSFFKVNLPKKDNTKKMMCERYPEDDTSYSQRRDENSAQM